MSDQTWDYRGQTISLTNSGKFAASVSGEYLVSSSLPAIKKKIDAALDKVFEPFDVIVDHTIDEKTGEFTLLTAKVVGIVEDGRARRAYGRGKPKAFKLEGEALKDRYRYHGTPVTERAVIRDTPENRAAYIAHEKAKIAKDEAEKFHRKAVNDAHGAIKFENANPGETYL